MNYLLIGGAQSVGKSDAVYRTAEALLRKGFTLKVGKFPTPKKNPVDDFRIIIEGMNKNGSKIRILLNSPTDTPQTIYDLKRFYDENMPVDIIISSVRDDNFWPRNDFFQIMNITPNDYVLEIPLAKITRRGNNHSIALQWYESKLDNLIANVLNATPYNL